jgi:AcrR family transcriptional regulator
MLCDVPKLWTETIETHRREVHAAILETAAALVAEHGLTSVTMSQIAEEAGIGRATLYKYFPDVEAILVAWHEEHVDRHIGHLAEVRDRSDDPGQRLEAVLEAYALMSYERAHGHADGEHATHAHRGAQGGRAHKHPGGEIAALVHRREHVARAERKLTTFMADLLSEGAKAGRVRDDVSPEELARYCLHALAAAAGLSSKPAVHRLVAVALSGLRPPRAREGGAGR